MTGTAVSVFDVNRLPLCYRVAHRGNLSACEGLVVHVHVDRKIRGSHPRSEVSADQPSASVFRGDQ